MPNSKNKEVRLVELRSAEGAEEAMIIEGYAVVFDNPATHYEYTEIVDRNAFNNCNMQDVCMKYNHLDTFPILARTRNHSLELIVDDKGLKIRASLVDTTNNRDVYKMIKNKLLDKMSFSFHVSKHEWDNDTNTRRILEIDKLFDVSVVDVPFYDNTEVYARNLKDFKDEVEEQRKIELEKEKAKLLLSL